VTDRHRTEQVKHGLAPNHQNAAPTAPAQLELATASVTSSQRTIKINPYQINIENGAAPHSPLPAPANNQAPVVTGAGNKVRHFFWHGRNASTANVPRSHESSVDLCKKELRDVHEQ
jgi:hypothetical protein